MKKLAFIILYVVFCATGCNHELDKPKTTINGVSGGNFMFYSDKELFDHSLLQRSVEGNIEFSIVKVEAVKNYFSNGDDALVITTSMSGECNGDYKVIWDGSVMESHPRRINLFLNWSGTCDNLSNPTEEVLILNVNELIADKDLIINSVFSVINGSVSHAGNDQAVTFN